MTNRHLTAGEIALCKTVFGTSIDYAKVTVHPTRFLPFQPSGCSMAPNGHLYMYGTFKDDYTAEGAEWRTHFMHEMTHVWQYQNKVLDPIMAAIELTIRSGFNYMAGYAYKLEAGKDLVSYNMEQQASIVEDYYALTRESNPFHQGRCQNSCSHDEKIALYETVLKQFLKNPHYARRNELPKPPRPPKI